MSAVRASALLAGARPRQLGHTDSRFTDRVYRQTPRHRRDRLAPAHRREFDRALNWAHIGGEVEPAPAAGTVLVDDVDQLVDQVSDLGDRS